MQIKIIIVSSLIFSILSCKNSIPDFIVGYPLNHTSNADPGFVLKIVTKDSTVYQFQTGVEDVHSKKPIQSSSLFNVGSISKTFVAYGILTLAKQGKINLTDSLIKYFPVWKNPELGKKVRIYHLMTHSSGLPDNRPIKKDSIYFLTADDAQNWAPIMQNDSLEFEPGTRFHYSNPAFNALALIIQQITGTKWQEYIQQLIFVPSGMKTSTITDGAHPDHGVSHAYLHIGNTWKEQDYGEEPTFNASGNGGVWSSVDELYLYEKAIRQNIFADKEIVHLSRTIYPLSEWKDSKPSQLGLSFFIDSIAHHPLYGHTGSQGGFTADFVSIPDQDFFYSIISNVPLDIDATRIKVLQFAKDHQWIKP